MATATGPEKKFINSKPNEHNEHYISIVGESHLNHQNRSVSPR